MKKAIIIPILSGIVMLGILYGCKVPGITIYKVDFVMNAIITCVITLVGFILTSVSIVIGMSGNPIMKKISDDGGLPELITRYTTTLVLSLLVIFVFISMGATLSDNNFVCRGWIITSVSLLFSYVISLIGTCYYLLKIISLLPNCNEVKQIKEPSVPDGEFK